MKSHLAIKAPLADWKRLRPFAIILIILGLLTAFTVWSGVPRGDNAAPFWLGVGILVAILFFFATLIWHLLVRPLAPGLKIPTAQTFSVSARQSLALLLSMGGMGIVIGIFWDEVWHRQFGVPFGDDFLWRPHLLMYFGFASVITLAFAGLLGIMRRDKGTLQQRFRANPVVGMMIMLGAFLMFVLPADPLWHSLYGQDITAWGVPHLLVVMSFVSMNLLSVAIHQTTQPALGWRKVLRFSLADIVPIFNFVACLLSCYQFTVVEWDARAFRLTDMRPDWLLPCLLVFVAVWISVMANHSLRLPGAATVSALVALAVRFALIQLFGVQNMLFTDAWRIALVLAITIDIYYVFTAQMRKQVSSRHAGLVGTLAMVGLLFTIYPQFYLDFPVDNVFIVFIALLLTGLGASWFGAGLGDYFATAHKQVGEARESSRVPLASLVILAGGVLFIIFFVTTATPPI